LCREEGLALNTLAASETNPLDGFGLFGVVKETGVDDEGLIDFHSKYFPRPLYRDEDKAFYDALGGRKLKLTTYNPFKWYRFVKSMSKRHKEKGLEGNMKGEGLVQGGVIVFGKDGKAKYAYEEDTGSEIPLDDILAAVKQVRGGAADASSEDKEL